MRTSVAGLLVAGTLAIPTTLTVAAAPPSTATPCDHSAVTTSLTRGKTLLEGRLNGDVSIYNKTQDTVTKRITFGRSTTNTVNKHWEVGASGSAGWGPVKAEVSAKYGEAYTKALTVSASDSLSMDIRPKHTGWVQVAFYQKAVFWKARTERWDPKKGKCVKRLIKAAYWGAPQNQLVPITKKGRKFPN